MKKKIHLSRLKLKTIASVVHHLNNNITEDLKQLTVIFCMRS